MKNLIKGLVLIIALIWLTQINGNASMAQFKALYLYNFAKYTGWPPSDSGNDLVITIIGDKELTIELEKIAQYRLVGNRKIVVREAESIDAVAESQIVYVAESQCIEIHKCTFMCGYNQTLIIAGRHGFCADGAGIALALNNGKLSFDYCDKNIRRQGLSFSQKLEQQGVDVED